MVDIRQLRYFITVAETLHFGRAAQILHVSQPPLSRQVQALERDLGVTLIERNSRHARLTASGERFLDEARGVVAALDQACRNAQLVAAGSLGELRIGFMMHAAHSSLPPIVKRFMEERPEVDLQLKETLPSEILDQVLRGDLDAAITFGQGAVKGLAIEPILREPLILAAPDDHPLAGRGPITPAMIAEEGLIVTPRIVAPPLRAAIDSYFAAGQAVPRVRLETQLQHTIISLVAQGIGIALVPHSMARLGTRGVRFASLDEAPEIEHALVWRTDNRNPALPFFTRLGGLGRA
ncbi:LysR family transcriptional regulator [Novosphingobium profundi]|uniref:LysR family transcriptional regulator n=1 Tax=Novosphingobium profundi TaxID=1774954 RepID=UPI001BD9DF22|nr:LysR family transcriptional regulator [Novosphingobium profundi]MBT0670134.1 LysR family transcriptional regulator [Novosphingobium profundi]